MWEFVESVVSYLEEHLNAFLAAGVLISALVSVFGVWWAGRSSHRSNVSQMRERWIESLRLELSEILALQADHMLHEAEDNNDREYYRRNVVKRYQLYNSIRLRLNDSEKLHHELIEMIRRMIREEDDGNMGELQNSVVQKSRQIMREEWKKAAKGQI
jgi:hypothetical protein